jgi:DNA-binding NarL/FixJ family response regulator
MRNIISVVQEFKEKHGLTNREFEILVEILNGCTSTKNLSQKLGISPNTIRNHLENMISKSGFSSRIDILQHIIAEALGKNLTERVFYSSPAQIYFLEDGIDFLFRLKEIYTLIGCRVDFATTATELLSLIKKNPRVDMVGIHLANASKEDRINLLKTLRTTLKGKPEILVITSLDDSNDSEYVEWGANTIFKLPRDPQLFLTNIQKIFRLPGQPIMAV